MQKEPKTRREILKILVLAGFGLLLPSCNENVELEEETIPETSLKGEELEKLIAQLDEKFETKNVLFLVKTNEEFEKYNTNFNRRVLKNPKIIAVCKNDIGVQESIKYANKKGLKVAVKSGGHSFENFSSINDGLVINLSLMNKMSWKNEIIVSQPAVLLWSFYDFILPKKRIVPVGSCGSISISGLTLGGGYGFFSRQYGLTCDSLVEATMVDGKGKIHKAKQGDELLWALKGGGNGNFGVITELKYKTYPMPKFFSRYRFKAYKLDKERTKLLLEKWFEYTKLLPNTCFSAFVLNGKTLILLLTNIGEDNKAVSEMVDIFTDLMDKTNKKSKRKTEDSMSTYFGVMYPIYFKNSSAGFYKDFSTIKDSLDEILDILLNNRLIFQINTFGGKINSAESEKTSCFPHRESSYLCELQSYWDNDKQKPQRIEAFNKVQEILFKNGIDKQYRNYPNLSFPNYEKAYYGKNYSKLQKLKTTFDPNNIFEYEQIIKAK